MEVRSEGGIQVRCDKLPAPVIPRTRLQVWFIWVCSSILLWTCLVQLVTVGELWRPHFFERISNRLSHSNPLPLVIEETVRPPPPPPLLAASEFFSRCHDCWIVWNVARVFRGSRVLQSLFFFLVGSYDSFIWLCVDDG